MGGEDRVVAAPDKCLLRVDAEDVGTFEGEGGLRQHYADVAARLRSPAPAVSKRVPSLSPHIMPPSSGAGVEGDPMGGASAHTFGPEPAGRFTFDTFRIASSNSLAAAAARSLAEASCDISFRLLYIHGAPGLGKTHLLRAVGHLAQQGGDRVSMLSGRMMTVLPIGWRSGDVVLVDDFQSLAAGLVGKRLAAELLLAIDAGRRVVVVADCPPHALDLAGPHLVSRLHGGLVAEVLPMGDDLRRSIIDQRISDLFGVAGEALLPALVRDRLASTLGLDGRGIDGALHALHARWVLPGEELTPAIVQEIVGAAADGQAVRVRVEDILAAVCARYGVSRIDIKGQRRTAAAVRPRQIAMYLAKTMTLRSLPEIGRILGGRDHTTVLHAVRKLERMVTSDAAFSAEIETLRRLVLSGGGGHA